MDLAWTFAMEIALEAIELWHCVCGKMVADWRINLSQEWVSDWTIDTIGKVLT